MAGSSRGWVLATVLVAIAAPTLASCSSYEAFIRTDVDAVQGFQAGPVFVFIPPDAHVATRNLGVDLTADLAAQGLVVVPDAASASLVVTFSDREVSSTYASTATGPTQSATLGAHGGSLVGFSTWGTRTEPYTTTVNTHHLYIWINRIVRDDAGKLSAGPEVWSGRADMSSWAWRQAAPLCLRTLVRRVGTSTERHLDCE